MHLVHCEVILATAGGHLDGGSLSIRELGVLRESNVYQPPSNGDQHHAHALGRIILVSSSPLWEITALRRALR